MKKTDKKTTYNKTSAKFKRKITNKKFSSNKTRKASASNKTCPQEEQRSQDHKRRRHYIFIKVSGIFPWLKKERNNNVVFK